MDNQRYLTVNALTKYIKRKFDADPHLQGVYIKGEISNFKRHSSGHMYFTLKDEKARILAVMFAGAARSMKFKPENGMKVLVRGDISVYEGSGQYQVYIKEMKTDGVGDLFVAYEQLKKKLEQEGLFSPKYKQPIPKYPKAVGIVTSPTGAAIRDILTTIKRRYPITKVMIFPALVQGDQGGPSIVRAIEKANARTDIDVLIIGRGGGSIEELWNFNEESVARAIFASKIPIISAVGHETDFTIADFVADMRAPTPTGAAELAVPHIQELIERVMNRETRLMRAMREKVFFQQERYQRLIRSYAFRYPRKLYEQKLEQVDKLTESLTRGAEKLYFAKNDALLQLKRRLERSHPEELRKVSAERHVRTTRALNRAMTAVLSEKRKEFDGIVSTLEALSPLKIMDRGYSLAYTDDGELIKTVTQVKPERKIKVKLSDGSIQCVVTDIKESENDGR
ncbi:exodeoxyribonuclease VII large subunit [Bacillus sp. ISL-37]|jgi:exodeoxyribonuclease VII large subunit|uniref:exodeoxyribonuclease VII large subunit n=1 Tax=Bacillus sp. ISL-37 TaxID=2819123 RepID=UPI001BECB7E0|nr:exodeoxyribonuclease VII large subunit [Bacillus sp. ISL-37]MBT2684425.1 exodeoxyribonuclease VII large subunit [Bacillus sp. ISL-37]